MSGVVCDSQGAKEVTGCAAERSELGYPFSGHHSWSWNGESGPGPVPTPAAAPAAAAAAEQGLVFGRFLFSLVVLCVFLLSHDQPRFPHFSISIHTSWHLRLLCSDVVCCPTAPAAKLVTGRRGKRCQCRGERGRKRRGKRG